MLNTSMRTIPTAMAVFIALVFLTGCYSTNFRFEKPQNTPNAAEQNAGEALAQTVSFSSVGFGIHPLTAPVRPMCNQGQVLKKINFEMNKIDSVIHFLIGGIYTSRHVNVYCK